MKSWRGWEAMAWQELREGGVSEGSENVSPHETWDHQEERPGQAPLRQGEQGGVVRAPLIHLGSPSHSQQVLVWT